MHTEYNRCTCLPPPRRANTNDVDKQLQPNLKEKTFHMHTNLKVNANYSFTGQTNARISYRSLSKIGLGKWLLV